MQNKQNQTNNASYNPEIGRNQKAHELHQKTLKIKKKFVKKS